MAEKIVDADEYHRLTALLLSKSEKNPSKTAKITYHFQSHSSKNRGFRCEVFYGDASTSNETEIVAVIRDDGAREWLYVDGFAVVMVEKVFKNNGGEFGGNALTGVVKDYGVVAVMNTREGKREVARTRNQFAVWDEHKMQIDVFPPFVEHNMPYSFWMTYEGLEGTISFRETEVSVPFAVLRSGKAADEVLEVTRSRCPINELLLLAFGKACLVMETPLTFDIIRKTDWNGNTIGWSKGGGGNSSGGMMFGSAMIAGNAASHCTIS